MEAYIVAGDLSTDVMCTCLTVGSDGNVNANTITILNDDYLDDKVTVNNETVFTDGSDYEDDDTYRERLLETIQESSFGSLPYYTNLAENITGVHDVLFLDDTDYTKRVIVNGDSKPVTDAVLMDVLTAFTDTNNIVIGHNFIVASPDYVNVNLTVNLDVENTIDTDIITEVINTFMNGGVTSEYLEFDGLKIGEELTRRELYFALEQIDFVVDVRVIDDNTGEEITSITPEADEVLKLNDLIINQTEV